MRSVIAVPVAVLLYLFLLVTSFIARSMAVVSVMFAAATVNVVLWSGTGWLITKVLSRLNELNENSNTSKEIQ
jgi:positive regulator of sigma E activity